MHLLQYDLHHEKLTVEQIQKREGTPYDTVVKMNEQRRKGTNGEWL